jgi:hypothetical protein
MATLQSQAVQMANGLISVGQALAAAKVQIDQLSAQYTQLTLGTTLAALATAAVNSDGSLGTQDGSPTSGHVIDIRAITGLSRAISASDLGSLLSGLQAVSTLLSGSSVSQQGQMPQILAKIVGG